MPSRTFTIYEVPDTYVSFGTDPTISGIFSMTISDDDGSIQATAALDPGAAQVITFDGGPVNSYQFFYDDNIDINGSTETIRTFQLDIGGVTRSFVMSDTGSSIPGAAVGDGFTLNSYAGYTALPYASLPCFAQGSRIETDRGEQPIETLCVGDLVRTKDHGYQPIRWVGNSRLSVRDLLAQPHLRPVRIVAGAFGENLPARDLRVSPQHRLLLDGWEVELHFGLDQVLAAAKSLTGRPGVGVDHACRAVEYFHVMFDQHQVIYSEGLATESFLVGETIREGMDRAQRDELLELFPELAARAASVAEIPARPVLRNFEATVFAGPAA